MSLSLPKSFQPFVKGAPCAVIVRLMLEYLIDETIMGILFAENADEQYEREITLGNLVNILLDVVCGKHRSTNAAYWARKNQITASLQAFYGKLKRTELAVSEAVVEYTGKQAARLIRAMNGLQKEPVPGFRTCVLDGNMLTGTEHRLKPLRRTRAAALPGKSLVWYECATGVVTKTLLEEDAHCQERAMLPDLEIPRGTHVLADRNFCVTSFMLRIQEEGSYFTIRRHRSSFPLNPVGRERYRGLCPTGKVSEQKIQVADEDGQILFWRKITLTLDVPTREGETEIVLISNLPATVKATTIAIAYRQRWKIEQHFQRLTDWLHCEIPTLSHPRAALFVFSMSLVAANAFAILIAALRASHGEEAADNLSYMYLVDEVGGTYRGMMVALPPHRWTFIRRCTVKQIARLLLEISRHADLSVLTKSRRGPKKPRPKIPKCKKTKHVSTYRLLKEAREKAC